MSGYLKSGHFCSQSDLWEQNHGEKKVKAGFEGETYVIGFKNPKGKEPRRGR